VVGSIYANFETPGERINFINTHPPSEHTRNSGYNYFENKPTHRKSNDPSAFTEMRSQVLRGLEMRRMLLTLLVVLTFSPALANISVFSDTQNPLAAQSESRPAGWVYVPEVIFCGARMFLAAAQYSHTDLWGYDFYANDQALRLVYNCMTYLLDPDAQSVTSGTIGCMGEFGIPNGLQEGYPPFPPWDIDFMQYLEDNLSGVGCTFDLVHITGNDPLVDAGQPLYDIVMIGDEWVENRLHTRSEYSTYVGLGGKLILAGTWNDVPDPSGMQLAFLPKNTIWIKRFSVFEFLLPAEDPSHPIAKNINNPAWWYATYELLGMVINPHNFNKIVDYDEEYYTKIFSNPPGYPDSPTTLVLGGQWIEEDSVTETSWGSIKAQF